MTLGCVETGIGWRRALVRGGAALALLGSVACQQAAPESGMFGTATNKQGNGSAEIRSARPQAPGPGAQPAQPGTQIAVAPPMTAPPAPVAQAPGQTAPVTAANADRRVRINNMSGQTITLIRGSAASDRTWGADRIPSGVLNTGASVIVDFNDNNGECVYDLQATLQDGSERVQRAVNVCQVTDWTITPEGTQAR